MQKTEWTYFNLHDSLRLRVEKGHPSEYMSEFLFGPFRTDFLEQVDLTLQFRPPEIGEYSFASDSYLFTSNHVYVKQYKIHLAKAGSSVILAGKRNLLPYVGPVLQWLMLQKGHCLAHAAAVAVNGRGILLPAWGGTGKTTAIVSLLKKVPGASFLSDDYTILSEKGYMLAYPKAFFIYPYHRDLFPHLFKARHKPLMPPALSGALERVRKVVRPVCMAFPRLENIARRITPEHMLVPAHVALPDVDFSSSAPVDIVLFVVRYSGEKTLVEEIDAAEATRQLVGNWYYEQYESGQNTFSAMGSTALVGIPEFFNFAWAR
jgi:hypothetical protein